MGIGFKGVVCGATLPLNNVTTCHAALSLNMIFQIAGHKICRGNPNTLSGLMLVAKQNICHLPTTDFHTTK